MGYYANAQKRKNYSGTRNRSLWLKHTLLRDYKIKLCRQARRASAPGLSTAYSLYLQGSYSFTSNDTLSVRAYPWWPPFNCNLSSKSSLPDTIICSVLHKTCYLLTCWMMYFLCVFFFFFSACLHTRMEAQWVPRFGLLSMHASPSPGSSIWHLERMLPIYLLS